MTRPRRRQAGEGGISEYRLKSGDIRYFITYSAPEPDGIGTRQVLRRGFLTRKAAAAELRKVMGEIAENRHAIPTKMTLGDYLTKHWLPGLRLAASTSASYRRNVRLHVNPRIGSLKLTELTASRLTAYYKELEQEGRADATGGLSSRTVRYIHTILHRALRDAVEEDRLIAINPADRAKPPTKAEARAPELRYWTPAQLGTFLAWSEAEEDDLFPAWQLLAATGMRRGELLGLRWGDIDFGRPAASIRRNAVLVRDDQDGQAFERIVIKLPKSGKSRVVDIDTRTVATLKAHRQRLAGIGLVHAQGDAPVFPGADGDVRHPERFSREFGRRLARARRGLGEGIPVIRLHDLRHTHATALLAAGAHPKVVQERLGHANISITLDTYSHVVPTMQRQAADMFQVAVYGA